MCQRAPLDVIQITHQIGTRKSELDVLKELEVSAGHIAQKAVEMTAIKKISSAMSPVAGLTLDELLSRASGRQGADAEAAAAQ
jgi:hypothetical protein